MREFLDTYADGPQNREVGAGCASSGQIDKPGLIPYVPGADGATFVPGPADTALISASGDVPQATGQPTELGVDPSASTTPAPTGAATPAPSASGAATPAPTASATR